MVVGRDHDAVLDDVRLDVILASVLGLLLAAAGSVVRKELPAVAAGDATRLSAGVANLLEQVVGLGTVGEQHEVDLYALCGAAEAAQGRAWAEAVEFADRRVDASVRNSASSGACRAATLGILPSGGWRRGRVALHSNPPAPGASRRCAGVVDLPSRYRPIDLLENPGLALRGHDPVAHGECVVFLRVE